MSEQQRRRALSESAPHATVMGSDYHNKGIPRFESPSGTPNEFIEVLKHTTRLLGGRYHIEHSFEWIYDDDKSDFITELTMNHARLFGSNYRPVIMVPTQVQDYHRSTVKNLPAGIYTFSHLVARGDSDRAILVRDINLELWRVA